ncbi:MAG: HpaII family restriction endonuclease [Bacilli bacterium]|nr:HpaII family restriction endonuclease [Bacilli bacterium]
MENNNDFRGNKGEWAEIYIFLKLLADGKLYAADRNLKKIDDTYLDILKIIREENKGDVYSYRPGNDVSIYLNEEAIGPTFSKTKYDEVKNLIWDYLDSSLSGTISIPQVNSFLNDIHIAKLKAPAFSKSSFGGTSDIVMEVMDYRSGSNCTLGFSCKSNLTAQATLFNASKNNTNFIYEVTGPMTDEIMNEFNSLVDDKGHVPISARIQYLKKKNMNVLFVSPAVESAKRNLILSGGKEMPLIVGGLLKYYYWENEAKSIHSSLLDGLTYVTENDIADYQLEDLRSVYERKISTLLYDMFTGMRLASNWDGHSSVNGGYIVLKPDGSVVAYHSIIADQFKEYLIDSLAFDTPSVNRHDYMKIYKKEGKYYLKFNMQIRFRKKNDN